MEMRNRQVNHARNLWDRAVTILPRANQFWYKYTYMEEMLGNVAGINFINKKSCSVNKKKIFFMFWKTVRYNYSDIFS